MANERLIDKDPEEDEVVSLPFYKDPMVITVMKITVALGVISTLLTGLVLTNSRLTDVETQLSTTTDLVITLTEQQAALNTNLKILTSDHEHVKNQVSTLDLQSAKGDLATTLSILDTQSKAIDKQLATTRNGMMSLSRMIKGSRVWQDDYKNQYQKLFDDNKQLKAQIDALRGVQQKTHEEPQYLELDF